MTGSLAFPSSASREQSRTEADGKVTITFEEDFYDLSGEYTDIWKTVWNTATNSYLPLSHLSVYASQMDGPEDSFARVQETVYTPVEEDLIDLPDNCV